MQHLDDGTRKMQGCGLIKAYREAGPQINAPVAQHTSAYQWNPTVCPGYTRNLPAVQEAYSALSWWDRGQLVVRYQGAQPPEDLVLAIDIIHARRTEVEMWLQEREKPKS